MLRPRILSTYNYKRRTVDNEEKNDDPNKCTTIMSEVEKVQPNYAELTAGNKIAINNEIAQKQPMKMDVSVTKKASVICRREKVVQTGTKRAINIVRLAPQASAHVYQMVTESSRLKSASSGITRKLIQNPSPRVRNLAVNHSSGRVVKLVPHSSTRVAPFVPTTSTKVSRLVSNVTIRRINTISHATKNVSSLVPNPSRRLSQSMTNALTRKKQQQQWREESLTRIQGSMPNPLSLEMQLSNFPVQQRHSVATSSPKIGETAPRSPEKVATLVKLSSTKPADSSADSPTAAAPRAASKPSIKSIERLTKGVNNSNVVMVLPVPGNEATIIESQTICRLEKIQHWKDVTRVQQVIGIQRQHSTPENYLLPSGTPKLGIVTPQIIEPRFETNVPEMSCGTLKGENNVDSKKEFAKVQEVPAETSEEANFVTEDEKPSESRMSANGLVDIKNESFSAAKKLDTEEPEVEVVDVKEPRKESDPRRTRSRTCASNRRKNPSRDWDNATTRMATRMRKSTILKTRRRNTRSAAKPNQTRPQTSAVARMQSQLSKTIASLNIPVKNKWRAQCIICKDRFTDKYDFHRHVTLSHPGIRIVFCELCNASFRTDIELQQHRYSYHKITVTKDAENNLVKLDAPIKPVVDLENESRTARPKTIILDDSKPVNRKKTVNAEQRNLEPTPGSRSSRKRVTASCMETGKLKGISQLDPVGIGARRKRWQNKRKNSKCSYVDIDIIDHEAIANNEILINAEKRKLIIPIIRLEGSVIEKYLPKLVKTPDPNDDSPRVINHRSNSQKKKSATQSSRKKRFVNPRSNGVSDKSASRATGLTSRKRRRTPFAAKKSLGNEKNATIGQDSKVVGPNSSKGEASVAPRRSLRSRKAGKSLNCNADKASIDGLAKIESPGAKSRTDRESGDFTLVYVEDEPEVAEVVAEQKVINKRVSRSSVSTSYSTLDHDPPEIDAEFGSPEINDGEKDTTKRRSFASLERQNSEFKDPRPPTPGNSTLIDCDEKLTMKKRSPSTPRFSCLNLYEGRLSNNCDSPKNRDDGEPDGRSKKRDKKAVVKKNIKKDHRPIGRRKLGDGELKNKSDDKSPSSEERIAGEDDKEKKENGSDGKNLDEKSSEGGNRSNGNSNQGQKHSKATSVTDTLRKKQSDDEDEEPKRRNNDEAKKLREKMDEEEEDDEKDEKKRKGQDDPVNETKYEESTNKNQCKRSANGDVVKATDKKNNVGSLNQKEIKKSTDTLESPVRKTYSSSKKLLKMSKQTDKSVEKKEKLRDLCTVCKKLSALMEKVSNQVGNRNTMEFPIKCPLCQRYFISTFHLELHVATSHLQCQHEIPCKIAELPGVEKRSTDVGLDCTTKNNVAFQCLRCSSKFNSENDLTDHLAGTHDVRPRKDKSSNVHADCIGDVEACLAETNGQKNVVAPWKSGDESQLEENKKTPATLDCSLCDEKFVESTKYVRHVREIHNTWKTCSSVDRKGNAAQSSINTDKLRPMLENPFPNVSEASSKLDKDEKATGTEQADSVMRSDRDYVLKQLLSDDSSDGDDHDETLQKFKAQRSKDSPLKVQKTDKIAHHLLFRTSHTDGKFVEDRSEVFVLSDSEDELNYEKPEEATNDEFSTRKKRVFVYDRKNEGENVAVVFGTNGASEKVLVGSKRRANLASFEMSEIAKVKKEEIAEETLEISGRSGDQSSISSGREPRDARKYAMKQLIETEVGLTDEINEKLPIACGKCNRHFANRSLLNEHLFFLHDDSLKDTVLTDVLTPIGGLRGFDDNESSRRWHCETCVQNFKLFQSYSRHRYFLHGDDSMVHVCDNCSKVMTNVTMVNVHICTDVASYNCRACNETFPTGMSLRLHNTEKHMEKNGPHTCVVCKRNFLTNGMLERHKNSQRCSVRSYEAGKEIPSIAASPAPAGQLNRGEASNPAPKCVDEEIDETATTKGNISGAEDSIVSYDPFALRRGSWRTCRSKRNVEEESPVSEKISNLAGSKKRRGRPAKTSLSNEKASAKRHEEDFETKKFEKWPIVCKGSMLYIDETEIHQCALCQLYCLSRSTLRYHMAKIHSTTDEICQLCQKMYTTGKLIRHLIERHITSEDGQVFGPETACRIGTNVNEIDGEMLIKMLEIDRLVSLCEYRRFSDKNRLASYPCLICKKYFASNELYKYHYLLHHDTICALCNIEFKTGQDAARHKSEIHGSVGRYIWFADRTVMALTSTTNFTNITETIFMEKITREEKASNDEAEEIDGNEEIVAVNEKLGLDPDTGERIIVPIETVEKSIETTSKAPTKIVAEVPSAEATSVDAISSASDRSSQRDDPSLIIVVTDDDIKKFNIATRHPNIWGLAAKISSTCDAVTPTQVKKMLERHFEREEDFDV